MSVKKDAKFYVRISSELDAKCEQISRDMGMSKSSLIAYYVGQGVYQEEQKRKILANLDDPDYAASLLKGVDISLTDFFPKK